MSSPASQAFRRDRRVTPTIMVVYQWCYEHLDGCEKRRCKLDWIAAELAEQDRRSGMRQAGLPARGRTNFADISRALDRLVAWGYLVEHDKQKDRPRWFTLAHSVRDDLRQAG